MIKSMDIFALPELTTAEFHDVSRAYSHVAHEGPQRSLEAQIVLGTVKHLFAEGHTAHLQHYESGDTYVATNAGVKAFVNAQLSAERKDTK